MRSLIDSYTLFDSANPVHQCIRTVDVEARFECWDEDADFGPVTEETLTVTVLACTICGTPAQPLHRNDVNPSVCSRECGRVEDEMCDAANERYYAAREW